MLTLLVAGPSWGAERARRVLQAHQQGQRAFHLVAGNRHDVYALASAARQQGLDPGQVLRSSVLARAFTAHQLAALIEDTLPLAMAERLAYAAVVDPLDQYASEDIREEEGTALLARGLAKLRILERRRPEVPLLLVQHPGEGTPQQWQMLAEAAQECILLAEAPPRAQAAQSTLAPWILAERAPAREVMPLGPHHAHVPQPA